MEDKKSKEALYCYSDSHTFNCLLCGTWSNTIGQTPEKEVEEFNNQWGIVLADQIPALDGFLLGLGLGGLLAPSPGDVITAALGGSVGAAVGNRLKAQRDAFIRDQKRIKLDHLTR